MKIIIKGNPEECAALLAEMQDPKSGEAKTGRGVTADFIPNGTIANYLIDGNPIRAELEGKGEKK